jgi:hypothetical protein
MNLNNTIRSIIRCGSGDAKIFETLMVAVCTMTQLALFSRTPAGPFFVFCSLSPKVNDPVTFPIDGLDLGPYLTQRLSEVDLAEAQRSSAQGSPAVWAQPEAATATPADAAEALDGVMDGPLGDARGTATADHPSATAAASATRARVPASGAKPQAKLLYDLSGMVCHVGTLGKGHYTAYVSPLPASLTVPPPPFPCSDGTAPP